MKCEEIHWHQKSRFKWIKKGDGNTSFFHKVANGRKWKNLNPKLRIDEEEVECFERIANEAIRFFSELYSKDHAYRPSIPNLFEGRLSMEEQVELESPFSMKEVKEAVFSMNKDKALDLDGFSMHFYHVAWDVLKDDLMKVFAEFYERGIMSIGMRSTFIDLIPRKEGPKELSDYTPISLVCSLYKIIS